jgi:hypothetical protein
MVSNYLRSTVNQPLLPKATIPSLAYDKVIFQRYAEQYSGSNELLRSLNVFLARLR